MDDFNRKRHAVYKLTYHAVMLYLSLSIAEK